MRHFNTTDTISHSKYSYVTHMEWKDSPLPSNKKRKKIKRYFIFLSRWKYSLEIEFCILFINAFEHIHSNFCTVFLFKIQIALLNLIVSQKIHLRSQIMFQICI